VREREKRKQKGLDPCDNRHMLRRKLEPKIDHLLADKLQEKDFLAQLADTYNESLARPPQSDGTSKKEVEEKLQALRAKRQRILEVFLDGVITADDRDRRTAEVDRELQVFGGLLATAETEPETPTELDVETLLSVFEPFAEWKFLDREDKRSLLSHLCPEIGVSYYDIKHLTLSQAGCNEDNRKRTAR
jgi:hypothetical protein